MRTRTVEIDSGRAFTVTTGDHGNGIAVELFDGECSAGAIASQAVVADLISCLFDAMSDVDDR